jgi:acetate kinase
MKILVLNSGSSSQKSALFELGPEPSPDPIAPLWEGKLEWDGNHEALTVRNSKGQKLHAEAEVRAEERHISVEKMLSNLWSGTTAVLNTAAEISVVGHRIVHGGPKMSEPIAVTKEVKQAISEVSSIAPLHNKPGLQGIELIEKLLPKTLQIAVFDTGFHHNLPLETQVYPGPYEWYERGIRRYGFHGINHQYCAHRTAQLLGREISSLKIITCHLGNGCSLAAIDGGKSVDTTMGFTPLEGLMMGTRSGSIDPGILTFLMRGEHPNEQQLDALLNHKSGLLGVSGVSSDMRDIVKSTQDGNKRAKLAFDIFVHRLRMGIGVMAASLGGLDALVFTAGIGENSAEVRQAACSKLEFLGIHLDSAANSAPSPDQDISSPTSRVPVLVIRAQEDWAIAQECARVCQSRQPE